VLSSSALTVLKMEAFFLRNVKFSGLFYVDNGDIEFTLKVNKFQPDYTASYPITFVLLSYMVYVYVNLDLKTILCGRV